VDIAAVATQSRRELRGCFLAPRRDKHGEAASEKLAAHLEADAFRSPNACDQCDCLSR
jgi:hypothetical protein